MWIGVLWAGLRVALWIAHVGDKFRHGLLEKSLIWVYFWPISCQPPPANPFRESQTFMVRIPPAHRAPPKKNQQQKEIPKTLNSPRIP